LLIKTASAPVENQFNQDILSTAQTAKSDRLLADKSCKSVTHADAVGTGVRDTASPDAGPVGSNPIRRRLAAPGDNFDPTSSALSRHSRCRAYPCCLPRSLSLLRRHPGYSFRGSMAGLCGPLPTLHPWPRGQRCTAWGRCGSYSFTVVGTSSLTRTRIIS
jgi:hypothetical protein